MATRMQQRRGTASQWTSANPILNAGEIGWESDTNKFKIGDGINHWADLTYFVDGAELSNIIDGAPALLNTLNELAAAIGDDPSFFITVATNLSNHESDTTNVHGIVDTNELATKTYVTDAIGNATVDQSALAGSGLTWDSLNEQFTVDTTLIQERVINVSDTEIGYLANVTSDIQTQLNNKLESSDLTGYATKSYADTAASNAVAAVIDSAPEALNTLNELAAAIGDNPNFLTSYATTSYVDTAIGLIPAPTISIQQVNTSGTPTESYTGITTIQFDEDSGFDVTNPATGTAKIAMNSTFKYWEVDGIQKLTAVGLDTVNFVSGNGISISADSSTNPQSITISSNSAGFATESIHSFAMIG